MRVIVIGAGIIGASTAYRLAQAGVEVVVIEAGRVAGGTSTVSFAWVSACEKVGSREYFDLSWAGVRAHEATSAEFDGANWHHKPGVIQWRDADAEGLGFGDVPADQKLDKLLAWGYPAERITPEDLRHLEPEIDPAVVGNAHMIYYPKDGYIDAPVYIGAMIGAAMRQYGAKLLTNMRVIQMATKNGKVTGVVTHDGTLHEADAVVNCSGRWANDVTNDPALDIPLAPTTGIIAYTPATPTTIRKVLRTPIVNMRSDGAGRLMLRANDLDAFVSITDDPVSSHPQAQKLKERLWTMAPALKGIEIEAVRIAVRPIPKDGQPCVGPVPGIDNYFVAVTHGGVNISAFVGMALRDEIVHGRPAPELATYRPSRFFY